MVALAVGEGCNTRDVKWISSTSQRQVNSNSWKIYVINMLSISMPRFAQAEIIGPHLVQSVFNIRHFVPAVKLGPWTLRSIFHCQLSRQYHNTVIVYRPIIDHHDACRFMCAIPSRWSRVHCAGPEPATDHQTRVKSTWFLLCTSCDRTSWVFNWLGSIEVSRSIHSSSKAYHSY